MEGLPNELLVGILSDLPNEDLENVCKSNKKFQHLCEDNSYLWCNKIKKEFPHSVCPSMKRVYQALYREKLKALSEFESIIKMDGNIIPYQNYSLINFNTLPIDVVPIQNNSDIDYYSVKPDYEFISRGEEYQILKRRRGDVDYDINILSLDDALDQIYTLLNYGYQVIVPQYSFFDYDKIDQFEGFNIVRII